jgi:tripartite-type tricarboxylate transporter receptor subunit TctC
MRVVVPYPPGGITDLAGRVMADILAKGFGKLVIVENKGGGTGTLAQQYILQQPHDGHLLLSGGLGGLILPTILNPSLPINPQENFIPVAQVAELMNVLVVGRDVKARNLAELIEYGKANPGKLNYATNGVGSLAHFASVLFNLRAGTEFVHIPYRSSGEIITGLRNGDVHISFANAPSVAALIQAGNIRAIAVTGAERAKNLPNVPTMAEAGMPDFVATGWLGAYAPVGTPQETVQKLSDILVKGGRMQENIQRLETAGFQASVRDHASFDAFNRSEFTRWNDIARKENIKAEV